jgi:hypothetical protein
LVRGPGRESHPSVGVGEIILRYVYPLPWVLQSESHNEVNQARETPPVNHFLIGRHVYSIIYRYLVLGYPKAHVVGQPLLDSAAPVGLQRELGGYPTWLDHSPGYVLDSPFAKRYRESVFHILC